MECKIERKNGRLTIKIDQENYLPLAFKSFRATKRNISDFYNAGIRLFNVLTGAITSAIGVPYSLFGESWLDDEVYDFDAIDRQIELFIENAPDAYYSVMLQLDTREWWLNKYKDYPNSFTHLSQMEADEKWRELAAKYMQAAIRHIEEKYGDRVFGYFLLCGTTTEWFSDYSYEEPNELVEAAYRKWLGDESSVVPTKEEREKDSGTIFLEEINDENVINYRRFEAWQRSDTIAYFLEKAQEVLQHKKLMGLYYGYIFELGGPRLWDTGYLDYERIFTSENVDMISSPVSYSYRAQDVGSQQMLTNSTLDLHDKIYFLEHDQTTCILPDIIEGHRFVHPRKASCIEEDVNLLRRDFLLAFSNGIAMWWFDMLEGWYYHPRFMKEIEHMISISNSLCDKEYRSMSEIAVIVDPESMYYVNKNSDINNYLFLSQRMDLSYMGAPYELFSICDMKNIPLEQYKLFIFLDSFAKSRELEEFVEELKNKGKTILFSYACNVTGKEIDTGSMSDLLGFKVEVNEQPEESMLVDGLEYANTEIFGKKPIPCYKITGDVEEIAHYKKTGALAVGYQTHGYTIAFSGLASIREPILRKMVELAGVHSYTEDSNNIVYVNNLGLGVYHRNEKDAVFHLIEDAAFVDVFENKEYCSEKRILKVPYEGVRAKLLIRK